MAFCGKCGVQVFDSKFCPACGAEIITVAEPAQSAQQTPPPTGQPFTANPQIDNFNARLEDFNNTADTTANYDSNDIYQNKAMGVLAYLGIFVFIPIIAAPGSRFARFHANQGLTLFLAEIAFVILYFVVSMIVIGISWRLRFIVGIVGLLGSAFIVLAIIGIVNAANGRAKELPIIGGIKILK